MILTQNDILNYMNKEFSSESEQLEAFFSLIGTIFSNIQPAITPNIKSSVENILRSNISLGFSDGYLLFTNCLDLGKAFLAPAHLPPPLPFILIPPSNPTPSKQEVAIHIATLLEAWVKTGRTPAGSPVSNLILI